MDGRHEFYFHSLNAGGQQAISHPEKLYLSIWDGTWLGSRHAF
jgi:hypothetical protein